MISKLLSLLTRQERRRGILVLGMVVVMAAFETAGVASVMPFLSVIGNPDLIQKNELLAFVYNGFGFASADSFLIALGSGAFGLILFSALVRSVTLYLLNRFIETRRHTLAERLLETYLRQPYTFFLDRHSGDLSKSILSEVDQLIMNVVRPAIEMLAYGCVGIGILSLLFFINPIIAIVVLSAVTGFYSFIYAYVRGVLGRLGEDRVRANRERFTAAGEALSGIKDIKLLGREASYLDQFRGPSYRFAHSQAISQTLSEVPNFWVEAVGFGGIILLTLVLLGASGGLTAGDPGGVLGMLGLYAFAGLRLKPVGNKIYQGVAQLRFGRAALDAVYADLSKRTTLAEIRDPEQNERLVPRHTLAFEGVHYTYPNAQENALAEIDLKIPVGSSLGLIGTTGAGKTTMVDLLLGLLRPTQGRILVDDTPVTDSNLRAYQQCLGYVPQDIFLSDTTIAANIALGVPHHELDMAAVERAARMAQIDEFIRNDMPNGYETFVGERGIRLSGGQRQRIGIARALYHDPEVLVFDEATSALDTATERAVMRAISGLQDTKTVILIAHRLSTVRTCDQVVLLERGRVAAQGTYSELQSGNERFRTLAN